MKLLKKDIDLSEIKVRTRFAPSPTGHLHLGHVLSAEYVWQLAKKFQSDVLVRIEDHDTGRYREEYEVSILEDLKFLIFNIDFKGSVSKRSISKIRI